MNKKFILLFLAVSLAFILTGCGIEPPVEDLEKAKASIAKAEEVESSKYAADDYNKAKISFTKGETNIVQDKCRQNKDAREYLENAKLSADEAYKKAAPKYADHHVKEGEGSINKAKEVKADIAVKDSYEKANKILSEAKDAYAKKDYKTAWTKAKEAKNAADQAYQKAAELKSRSEAAIDDAQKSLEEVEKSTESKK